MPPNGHALLKQRRINVGCIDVDATLYERHMPAVQGFVITKTCLYKFDPLKPHFYIVKLGFTGVHIIFLISAQNIDCGTR